eukprot:1748996-Pyramimonas_sp.AAC.1
MSFAWPGVFWARLVSGDPASPKLSKLRSTQSLRDPCASSDPGPTRPLRWDPLVGFHSNRLAGAETQGALR